MKKTISVIILLIAFFAGIKALGRNVSIAGGRVHKAGDFGDINIVLKRSDDKGKTWDTTYFERNFPDPDCQGSILNIGKKRGKNIMAFCNSANEIRGNNLTLRISFDGGKKAGILFEKNNYPQFVFSIEE